MVHNVDPRQRMLRIGRYSASGYAYVVTTVTQGRVPLFADVWLGRLVVGAMRFQHDHGRAYTLAFVVMPDHVHWLLQLGRRTLTEVVHSVKTYSAQVVNRARGVRGKVWQAGFHDRAIRRDESLRAAACYIVANPLRAGLVADIGQYPLWDTAWPL